MKRQFKLKAQVDSEEAQKKLSESDIKLLRKLETLLPKDDPLVLERESLRNTVRRGRNAK